MEITGSTTITLHELKDRTCALQVGTLSTLSGIPEGTLYSAMHKGRIHGRGGYVVLNQRFVGWLTGYHPQHKTKKDIDWEVLLAIVALVERRQGREEARFVPLDEMPDAMLTPAQRRQKERARRPGLMRRIIDGILSPI